MAFINFASVNQIRFDMRDFFAVLLLAICTCASAQSVEKLYAEGKKLYDAKNYTQAIQKLTPAAQKGHKKAQYRLGRCYDKGNGVKEDDVKAFEWYSKSAAQNFAKAQYQLGKCYKNGEGTAKNQAKAVEYFTKAAKQDNGDAQLALGKCYMKGKGVAADPSKAKAWLNKAVNNAKDGKQILADLRKKAKEGDDDAIAILKILGK